MKPRDPPCRRRITRPSRPTSRCCGGGDLPLGGGALPGLSRLQLGDPGRDLAAFHDGLRSGNEEHKADTLILDRLAVQDIDGDGAAELILLFQDLAYNYLVLHREAAFDVWYAENMVGEVTWYAPDGSAIPENQ